MSTTSTTAITDARKLRSRKALHAAFLKLLQAKSLDQITIREIATTARLGHATFYRHYADKEALLDELAAEEIRRLVELALPARDAGSTLAACRALCQHIADNRKIWRTLLTGGAANAVRDELLAISHKVAEQSGSVSPDREMAELRITLSVNAIMEALAWWLRQRKPLPHAQVAEILEQLIAFHGSVGVA